MKSTVKDVMTSRVVYAKRGASFKEIAIRMRDMRVSGFPVVDDVGVVVSVVSEPLTTTSSTPPSSCTHASSSGCPW
jgi:predicted transcriptional regulator